MRDPRKAPTIAVEFRFSDGRMLKRSWGMDEAMPDLEDVPDWLENPRKSWAHPQDPVTFTGDVTPGWEAEAEAFAGPEVSQ